MNYLATCARDDADRTALVLLVGADDLDYARELAAAAMGVSEENIAVKLIPNLCTGTVEWVLRIEERKPL